MQLPHLDRPRPRQQQSGRLSANSVERAARVCPERTDFIQLLIQKCQWTARYCWSCCRWSRCQQLEGHRTIRLFRRWLMVEGKRRNKMKNTIWFLLFVKCWSLSTFVGMNTWKLRITSWWSWTKEIQNRFHHWWQRMILMIQSTLRNCFAHHWCLLDVSQRRCFRHVHQANPGHARLIVSCGRPGNASFPG